MQLSDLLMALLQKETEQYSAIEITGLVYDSRRVSPGNLFVAVTGSNFDGHAFIPQAVAAGAAAIVGERPLRLTTDVPYVCAPNSRLALAQLAAAWHGYPTRQLKLIGVTGTDGKTTSVNLIHSILTAAGRKAGMISTVNAVIGDETYDTGLHTTTPDALDVQRYLARMVADGAEYAVLEATSHGLAQHRVSACDFDVAVVTNITHEHLDYHGSYEQYRSDKARLFHGLTVSQRKPGVPKVAILNADDASYDHLRCIPADRQMAYAIHRQAEVMGAAIEFAPDATRFVARTPDAEFEMQTCLVGEFNVYNVLAAIAVGVSQGLDDRAIKEGIGAVRGVVGRMERIDEGQDFTAIVDFAHTPNALENALQALRSTTAGRLIVVFGCAGLRDVAKRPLMGEIAGRLADVTVITAEDPRTESLTAIMAQIAAGAEKAGAREGERYHRIGDRAEAIAFAVSLARPGDTVVVTGKGHERAMCFGAVEHPWSDHDALRAALRQWVGRN
jgi:UDP-N-acetylmuramoyl-L-alanyl-D-glutamate--2,6-diaminopimelate ligase